MTQSNQRQLYLPIDRGYLSQPTGYLLGKAGLIILLAFFLFAVWDDQATLSILLGLALSAAGLTRLWSRLSLVGVSCQRLLSERRVFPGEHIEMGLRLVNRKLLPVPWVQLDDEIPDRLELSGTTLTEESRPGFRLMSNSASLLWYTNLSWQFQLLCKKRGCYKIGPLVISSGDIFGFYPRSLTVPQTDEVIVYPRLYPVNRMVIPSLYPMGEARAARRIFADPTRTIGVRDYSPHDSLRYVHWKATARKGNLQVKVFEPTTTLKVAIFLAVDSFKTGSVRAEDNFELGVSTAASVANYLVQQRSSVGLYVNISLADSGQPIKILPGGGLTQFVNMLEALAKVVTIPSISFDNFLQEEWGRLPWGTTLILVISRPPDSLPLLLTGLKDAGYKTLVIQVGKESRHGTDRAAAWYDVVHPDDLKELVPGSVR